MGAFAVIAVVVGGVMVTAWIASRIRGSVPAVIVGAAPFLVFHRYLVAQDVVSPALGSVLLVVHVAATWVATSVGWIAASHRLAAHGLALPLGDELLIPELFDLRRRAVALGFEPVPNGTVWVGDIQITWLVHPDGTVAELVCSPDSEPGFGLATMLSDSTWVMSSPYPHGTDRTKIRVPGATFEELVDHHRSGVRTRAGERTVVVPDRDTIVSAMLELEQAEISEIVDRLWWSSFMAWFRQLTPSRYARA